MTTELMAKALPIQHKAFTVTANMTLQEYLAELSQEQRQLMQIRRAEVRLAPEQQEFLLNYTDVLNFVVLVTDDAPETVIVLPIIARIAAASPRFSLHIVRDTDDLSMLETAIDGLEIEDEESELDLPLLFFFDEEWAYQAQWGPQPEDAETYLDEWLEKHPAYERLAESDDEEDQDAYWQMTDSLLYEMRVWYNSALNKACIREICDLLTSLLNEEETED